jgi:hypothetical protein
MMTMIRVTYSRALGSEGAERFHVGQISLQWRALVDTIINILVP